jgi:hypothetical protein
MANSTNRQVISDIVTDLRAVNLDDKVSKRYILNKLRDFASLFIKRDAEVRRIFNISDLWVDVQCVEMCEAPLVECCEVDIPDCTVVMRSKKKIPQTYETVYKELIEVYNPTYAKEFKQISPKEYINIKLRRYQDKRIKYFWFSNGYLIIPDTMVQVVNLRGAFINPREAKALNSCEKQDNKSCVGLLDEPFVCPDYLLPVVKQEVLKDLFNFYKRIVTDENVDMNLNKKIDKDR